MGVLNVTPDSFFDGGRYQRAGAAVEQAAAIAADGADILDIGAESSRPGSKPVTEDEELKRLMPVLEKIRATTACAISVDTAKASVARRATAAGVDWINDIWGLQGDPAMAEVVAEARSVVVVMHNKAVAEYPDGVIADIERFFEKSLDIAARAGIAEDRIVLDPGIGFGKTAAQSLAAVRALSQLRRFRQPLLLGASRKSFIGAVLDLPVGERLEGSLATTAAAIAAGFDIVRVHDVRAHARLARMADAIFRQLKVEG